MVEDPDALVSSVVPNSSSDSIMNCIQLAMMSVHRRNALIMSKLGYTALNCPLISNALSSKINST